MTLNKNNCKNTHKCRGRLTTPTGELLKFHTKVNHQKIHVYDLNYNARPYVLIILRDINKNDRSPTQPNDVQFSKRMHEICNG